MASIMKRGNTYSVRYNYKDHAGKPCKGWETFKTKAEAQERKITVEKELLDGTFLYYLRSYLPILIIAILAATPLAKNLWAKLSTRGRQVAVPVLMLAGLALATAYLVDGSFNPFLYFRF